MAVFENTTLETKFSQMKKGGSVGEKGESSFVRNEKSCKPWRIRISRITISQ